MLQKLQYDDVYLIWVQFLKTLWRPHLYYKNLPSVLQTCDQSNKVFLEVEQEIFANLAHSLLDTNQLKQMDDVV